MRLLILLLSLQFGQRTISPYISADTSTLSFPSVPDTCLIDFFLRFPEHQNGSQRWCLTETVCNKVYSSHRYCYYTATNTSSNTVVIFNVIAVFITPLEIQDSSCLNEVNVNYCTD
jgi:hypothetical protein